MARFTAVLLTATPDGLPADQGPMTKIDGREVLLRSVELFLNRDEIKQIVLVFDSSQIDEAKQRFGAHLAFSGVKLVSGGPGWSGQCQAAAAVVAAESDHVLLHDAARPAVPSGDLDRLIETADQSPAVALSCLLKSAAAGGKDSGVTHPAGSLHLLLYPWAMDKQTFADRAASGRLADARPLTFLPGSGLNLRVSGPADATLAKAMVNLLPKPKLKAPSSPFEEAQW